MSLRAKLSKRSQPFLQPDERIQHIFMAIENMRPWVLVLGAFTGPIGILTVYLIAEPRIIAVTDQAIVVLRGNKLFAKPKSLVQRLPRETRIGPAQGKMWAKITLGGNEMYVHRRFHKDVEAADASIPA
jgi:hypothetical protein